MNWKNTTLGEVLTFQRGFDLPIDDRQDGIYPVVASTGIVGYHNSFKATGPGVVIGRSGSIGGGQYVKTNFWPLNTTLYIKDYNENDVKFCYYLVKNLDFSRFNVGSGVPTLNRNHIHPLQIPLPPLPEQRAIAEILSSIDDKIELNNHMNKTLEAMAQAIFKQWFVDFEFPLDFATGERAEIHGKPVENAISESIELYGQHSSAPLRERSGREKKNSVIQRSLSGVEMSGYKSSGGKMVDSELGPIPEGWSYVYYTEEINVLGGGTPSKSNDNYWNGTIPFFTPKDIDNSSYIFSTEDYITVEGLNNCNSKLYPQNTIFITARGTVGKICLAGVDMAMNQSCYALTGINNFGQYYIYLQTLDLISRLKQNSHGSVFSTITTDTFRKIKIIKPDEKILTFFEQTVKPVFDMIHSKTIESQTLSTLRDTLLPKLMSGELRVPEEIVKRYEETGTD